MRNSKPFKTTVFIIYLLALQATGEIYSLTNERTTKDEIGVPLTLSRKRSAPSYFPLQWEINGPTWVPISHNTLSQTEDAQINKSGSFRSHSINHSSNIQHQSCHSKFNKQPLSRYDGQVLILTKYLYELVFKAEENPADKL